MTNEDRIYRAWKRGELNKTPEQYVELMLRLCGHALRTEEDAMCEELYYLGLVQQFSYPQMCHNGILCYERRFMPLNHIGDEQSEKYQALLERVKQDRRAHV